MSIGYFLLLLVACSAVNGAKILMVFNAVSRSHYILGEALGKGLAEKGHQVTMISPFVSENKHPNYNEIILDGMIELSKKTQFGNLNFDTRNVSTLELMHRIIYGGSFMANATLYHPKVQKLMNSNAKFDAFITETFVNDCLLGMAPHFNAVTIVFSTVGTTGWTDRMVGNPSNPAYAVNPLMNFNNPMTYVERMIGTIFWVIDIFFVREHSNSQHELYENYFKTYHTDSTKAFPHLWELITNVSLLLLNTNYVVGNPHAAVPNMVDVAGLHVKPTPLPQDLQKFLDDAKEGAVYFSMGSNLRSADLPKEKLDAILKTFRNMKQKILWKWEDPTLPDKPDNVLISRWLPQQSILAHPNTKAFITHGGLLSSIETLYFGVPLLGIPIFADQHTNMVRAVRSGYGIKLEFDDLTEESFSKSLSNILNEPSYRQRAQELSVIFQDQQQTPLEKAVSNVEYVIRHKGAPFLRSSAVNMPLYQILLLDVIAGILLIISIPTLLVCWLSRKLLKACCREKTKSETKKKKH